MAATLFVGHVMLAAPGWPGPGARLANALGDRPAAERALLGGEMAVLAVLLVMGWLALQLARQQGRLLLRLETARWGTIANSPPDEGLPLGDRAPGFTLASVDGGEVALGQLQAEGRPVVLLFVDAGSGPCAALMPEIARWQRDRAEAVTIAVIGRGPIAACAALAREHGLTRVLAQRDREVAEAYATLTVPSAVLIDRDGVIASKGAVGPDAIRALLAHLTAPPAPNGDELRAMPGISQIGQPAPAVSLSSLSGESASLENFRGAPTLVLFWNPDCGYCQRLLDDLKSWEMRAPADAPRLLVISRGEAEENRELGLRSPILLDQTFEAARAFGARGTPAAVLIDASGRIASDLARGMTAVRALVESERAAPRLST